MLFKELKQGNFAYIINNSKEQLSVEKVKVISVGAPYFDNGVGAVQKVVDFTISRGNGNETYKIPETLSTTQAGTTILFADRDSFLNELEAMKNQSDDVINSIDYHRARKATLEKALAEYNPTFKEKREMEDRLSKMESTINRIEELLNRKTSLS